MYEKINSFYRSKNGERWVRSRNVQIRAKVKSDYNLLVGFLGFERNFTRLSFLQRILKYTEYFHLRLMSCAYLPWLIKGPKQNFGWDILIFPFVDFLSTSLHCLRKLALPAMFYCYLISHFCSLVCKPMENRCHVSFITNIYSAYHHGMSS